MWPGGFTILLFIFNCATSNIVIQLDDILWFQTMLVVTLLSPLSSVNLFFGWWAIEYAGHFLAMIKCDTSLMKCEKVYPDKRNLHAWWWINYLPVNETIVCQQLF